MKNRIIRDRKDLSNLVLERKKASDVKIAVEEILERVKEAGDVALIKYSNEFDKANFSSQRILWSQKRR